ncbi:MAG: hypothetical protein ACRDPY_17915 [Streptosporangiaceae bacterium]
MAYLAELLTTVDELLRDQHMSVRLAAFPSAAGSGELVDRFPRDDWGKREFTSVGGRRRSTWSPMRSRTRTDMGQVQATGPGTGSRLALAQPGRKVTGR